ncbi:MAG TPA: hypothetical protein VKD22_04855, partial [Ramlibacter sp.]|nr:hypothetical protein [Ramlibacter sp.]
QPTNHFEMVYPFTADVPQPILFVTDCDPGMQFGSTFDRAVDLGSLAIDTGPTSSRTYHAYLLSGVRQPPGAPPACGG